MVKGKSSFAPYFFTFLLFYLFTFLPLYPRTELFSEGEAFLIESFELRDIPADTIDLHRALRTDADDFTPVLHPFDEVELFVVGFHMMAENNTQTGILFIEQTGHLEVGLCGTEATITRHDHHIGRIAPVDGTHHWDGIDNAAIEHGDPIDRGDLRHIRQRTRGLDDSRQSGGILFLGEVFGTSCQTVGGHNLIGGGILTISLVVERHNLIGEALVEDVRIEDAPLRDQTLQGDIAILLQEVDIGVTGTTGLTAHIRQAVAGASGDCHHIGEVKIVLHKRIKYPRMPPPSNTSPVFLLICINIAKICCKDNAF